MKWLLFALSLPWALVGWLWVGLMGLFAAEKVRLEPYGIMTAIWRPWVTKPRKNGRGLWPYSTTIGRGIIYQPGKRRVGMYARFTQTERHELVHVRQSEDFMTLSFLIGLTVALTVGLGLQDWHFGAALGVCLWSSGGLWQLSQFVTSVVRHGFNAEGLYWSTEHERAARAETEQWSHRIDPDKRMCWSDYDREFLLRGRHL